MLFDNLLDLPDLIRAEAAAGLQTHRLQPEFGNLLFPFYMHVRRFKPVAGIEKETIGPTFSTFGDILGKL